MFCHAESITFNTEYFVCIRGKLFTLYECVEHHQRVMQNCSCCTPACYSELHMLNASVWRRTEHVEHQRVTQNWTCCTSACDAELNMLYTSVWLRTEHVEHQHVTQNWTCWTPACDSEFHSLIFMWANMKQFHRMKTYGCMIIFTPTQCGKITNVSWAVNFERHPSLRALQIPNIGHLSGFTQFLEVNSGILSQ